MQRAREFHAVDYWFQYSFFCSIKEALWLLDTCGRQLCVKAPFLYCAWTNSGLLPTQTWETLLSYVIGVPLPNGDMSYQTLPTCRRYSLHLLSCAFWILRWILRVGYVQWTLDEVSGLKGLPWEVRVELDGRRVLIWVFTIPFQWAV